MSLNIHEIKNVSKLIPFKRYKYFLKKVADSTILWTIVNENGDIVLSKIDENILITFWSAEPFIDSNLLDGWKDYIPFKIDLDDFEDTIMPLIVKNNYLINVFPINRKSGFIVNLQEFLKDLKEELKWYE